jgi:hypothetical protein
VNYTEFRIEYEDGSTETVRADQRDGQEFQLWANRRGITAPPGRSLSDVMEVVFVRVCAWSAHQRAIGHPVEWADWDKRAVMVDVQSVEPVDPTQPDDSGEPSPSSPSEPG